MPSLLNVTNLNVQISNDKHVATLIPDLSFSLKKGEILGIVGESGCGKSVTSLSIMRLLGKNAVIEGKIEFNGINVLDLSRKQMNALRGNKLSMIFQEPMTSLNPLQKIGKQVAEPMIRHLNVSRQAAKEKAAELLKSVGIGRALEVCNEYPHQLSGGMRQRVMIAMAMSCNPDLIIADEPTTALDVTIQAQILELMKNISKKNGTSLLFITHDLGVVAEMCDRVLVMYAGQIIEEADVATLFRDPKHPYTRGLLQSMPDINKTVNRIRAIPGTVPALDEMLSGCRFASRCKMAVEKCHAQEPDSVRISENHLAKCYFAK